MALALKATPQSVMAGPALLRERASPAYSLTEFGTRILCGVRHHFLRAYPMPRRTRHTNWDEPLDFFAGLHDSNASYEPFGYIQLPRYELYRYEDLRFPRYLPPDLQRPPNFKPFGSDVPF